MPETKRAAAIFRFGGPQTLHLHVLPAPSPDTSEVLIKLDTTGVGPWDASTQEGPAEGRPHLQLVLGTDGAGPVAAVGPRNSPLQVRALSRSARLAQLRYASGYSSYLEVLDANRELFSAELALSQAQRDSLVSVVQLYRALGGGWVRSETSFHEG
jgi:NADPH:quinone reductase-like Zn-dependent oxidoreductase